jgi:cytochrome o ubiquinol oxidase subunit 1
MFGKLTLAAIPFDRPVIMGAGALMVIFVLAALGALTWFGKWKWLWSEWLTSVDHKKIGVMYIVVAVLMLLCGFADAVMMRCNWRSPMIHRAICRRITTTRSLPRTASS